MRLLSNFDTGLEHKMVQKYEEGFGKNNVISIHKSRRFYIVRVLLPYVLFFIVFALGLTVIYTNELPYQKYIELGFRILILFYFIAVFIKTSKQYMNWKMDFLIITPKEVIKYDQSGVLHRDTESIPADKIRSVTVSKHGLMNSFFDIGSITFLAEGEEHHGDIEMEYIDAVEHVESEIRRIMGMDGSSPSVSS